jgi:glycosyltransferase involved in cell wall biosynthesis
VGYDIDTPAEDKEGPRTQFERVVFRSLSVVLAATIAKSARGARRLPRLGRRRNSVIPNGVDRSLFRPIDRADARAQLGWDDAPVVLFAADPTRFTKRFELAADVVELVREEFAEVRLVTTHDVEPNLMPVWMSAADVLLLTSRGEGSPNVVKEAMACDLPVVSVDVGDVREVIEGTRLCHVGSDEPTELAAAVVDALRALPARSDGRAHSAWLDDQAIAERVVEVYARARDRRPGILGFLAASS